MNITKLTRPLCLAAFLVWAFLIVFSAVYVVATWIGGAA